MKRSYLQNKEAKISEQEASLVEEVAGPIKFDALWIILLLFIVAPVLYVLGMQGPGSWLPKRSDSKQARVAPEKKDAEEAKQANTSPFATLDSAIIKASNHPSFDNYFQLSFEFYKAKKYEESVKAAQKALEFNPRSAQAYNNICSAYNELKQFDNAIEACKKALEIDSTFQLAKNNLKWAESQR
jgi:tetratricopeptide (TPR) repeat protein